MSKKNIFLKIIFFFFFSGILLFAAIARADFFSAGSQGQHFLNLIGEKGYNVSMGGAPSVTIFDLIAKAINYVLGFVAIIFLGLIIYGGYMWMFAAGDENKVMKAKKIINNAILGAVVLMLSGAIAHEVSNFVSNAMSGSGSSGSYPWSSSVNFKQMLINIINYVLSFLGIVFLGLVIYGGYTWMFSGGDSQKIAKAKKILINASIGAIVILLSFSIVRLVSRLVT